ncbi:MAG: ArsR family transcriptional regulator [Anaerolineales bacterium]|jgi:predicted ArsR family transcriptional regulator|nr:ArsR family transcriptional regulator [Anaerolineales bacterium]
MSPVKTNSRQKILNYLCKQNAATPIELAKALRVTPANIRYHLARLVSDGLVEVSGLRTEAARGRPHKIYGLSRLALGDNLPALASALLAEFVDGLPEMAQAPVLGRLAEQISPTRPLQLPAHITRRLSAVVEILNQMRYQARWEAHADGPRLTLVQCPYATVIAAHPALCLLDKALLELHLSQPVEQLTKLERNERGQPVCLFALR